MHASVCPWACVVQAHLEAARDAEGVAQRLSRDLVHEGLPVLGVVGEAHRGRHLTAHRVHQGRQRVGVRLRAAQQPERAADDLCARGLEQWARE